MELQKNNTSQENGMDHTSYLPEASLRPARYFTARHECRYEKMGGDRM